tara:strand:- start:269024 stop:269386 length:363 start_codon:yes stop_codon:yes gene_type:complete
MKIRRFFIAATMILSLSAVCNATAQDTGKGQSDAVSSLFESLETSPNPSSASDLRTSPMTAAELRQARALYRSRQRIARLERNLWIGHEPLRPNWGSTPMTSSRYSPNRTYYVPVYYYGR